MAKALSSLAVGTLVKDTGTLYNGKPIVWKIADKGHAGYPANSVTLITERIISLKCFDAIESGNSDSNRRSYGNNRWIYSNIRRWLNSQAAAGKWYAAQHSADAPPSNANVWSNYNEYDGEAGFLAGFSASFVAALLTTTHTVGKASVDGGGTETCTDKIFFASSTEVGLTGDVVCGSKLALFTDDASRRAKPTAECVSKSEYTNSSFNTNSFWYYWLCDAYASNSYDVRSVNSSGAMYWGNACYGYWGVRPLCNLLSSILVSDSPDSDGAYTIIWNRAPSTPPSLTVPTTVRGGQSLTVTWGTSTDADGNLSGYILERQNNGGAWKQLYKGINKTYTDTITQGWESVAYRVKAYDSAGAESAYSTSPTRTVINNTPPTISGNNGDLGTKTGAFNQAYTVTDPDSGQTLSVTEKIDNTVKRTYTATSGQNYSFNVTAAEWVKLANGSHTLTISAADNVGGTATRTYTFTKNETEIEMTLATPLTSDDAVTKAIMSVTRQIPTGATFTVEACNNAFDASPTWEDVTQAVTSGNKFFLNNTTKTAAQWGFNLRIKVKRNGATGDCYIVSAGGILNERTAQARQYSQYAAGADGDSAPADWNDVAQVRAVKKQEIGAACSAAIYAGIEVDGSRYSLTEHDQTELMAQAQTVKEGAAAVPYHADGELCRMYPAEEFTALAQAATAHVFYHRTYCNHMNAWIARADLEELPAIVYGAELPKDLAASMAAIIAAAGGGAA